MISIAKRKGIAKESPGQRNIRLLANRVDYHRIIIHFLAILTREYA